MNCNELRRHWNLYHDSEGDAELHFRIGEHLAMCPDCAQWFAQQSRLEGLLVDKLRAQPATPAMWRKVLGGCGLKKPVPARRWSWFAAVAACAMIAVAVIWYALKRGETPPYDLTVLAAQWHGRLEAGAETLQFSSNSDLAVEDYLRKRVTFPVRCPPRKDAGFAVEGAGVLRLADQPAAYLSGYVDATPVSIFVLPRDSLPALGVHGPVLAQGKMRHHREGPYQVVMAVIDRNAVLVIGETDATHLDRVLRAYGTYPDHP